MQKGSTLYSDTYVGPIPPLHCVSLLSWLNLYQLKAYLVTTKSYVELKFRTEFIMALSSSSMTSIFFSACGGLAKNGR